MATPSLRIALYQPDIPQNAGTVLRTAACLGLAVDVIEPCGFLWDDRKLRRSGMDYLDQVEVVRHHTWTAFLSAYDSSRRRVLLTTRAATPYTTFAFRPDDILLLGRESAGVPDDIHDAVNARVTIPLRAGLRSLNMAVAAAMVVGEALRQTEWGNGLPSR